MGREAEFLQGCFCSGGPFHDVNALPTFQGVRPIPEISASYFPPGLANFVNRGSIHSDF